MHADEAIFVRVQKVQAMLLEDWHQVGPSLEANAVERCVCGINGPVLGGPPATRSAKARGTPKSRTAVLFPESHVGVVLQKRYHVLGFALQNSGHERCLSTLTLLVDVLRTAQ